MTGDTTISLPRDISENDRAAPWLFPGLGCRYVGMGYDLIGRFPTADRMIAAAQQRLPYNIIEVCLEGSGRKHVPARQEAQVIYILSCAYAAVLREQGYTPTLIAGHSLGNLAAGYASGAYDFLTGLQLVTRVEELMEQSIDGQEQAMGVVIGLEGSSIRELLTQIPDVHLANWNSPLQYVVGGTSAGVDRVLAAAIDLRAKQAKRLASERAMHTPLMDAVAERFRISLDSIPWTTPTVPFINSYDTTTLRTAAEIGQFLGTFLSKPVHWQATVQVMLHTWGNRFVEVGPGRVLTTMLPFIDSRAAVRTASEVLDQKVQS